MKGRYTGQQVSIMHVVLLRVYTPIASPIK